MQDDTNKNQTSTSPTEVPIAAKAGPKAAASGVSGFFVDIGVVTVIAALVSAGVMAYGAAYIPGLNKAPESPFVVVNIDELSREQIAAMSVRVREGTVEVNDMPTKSAAFAKALIEQVQSHADAGKVVLRSDAVVAVPEGVRDLTDSIRDDLIKSGVMFTAQKPGAAN